MEETTIPERISTGIKGLDEMLKGGYFKGTANVVSGKSGTGKTIFGSQFIYEGAKNGEKVMCIITSEESKSIVREMKASFDWDFKKLEDDGLLSFVDITDPGLRLQKSVEIAPSELIKSFKKLIESKIDDVQPQRVFIDSIEALFLAIDSNYKLRTLIDDVFGVLRSRDVTSVISVGKMFGLDEMVEYGADSVVKLERVRVGNNLQRTIFVMKLRGSSTINEVRVLNISDNGMSVLAQSPYLE
ncbi:RAD55 family ATPase [Methanohalophilus portucalensis]|uniref:Circadian clock protein KaiC n=2 Tax=Methanohalophilus portucalensis TaxID=39664 RepID=A0A1L9C5I7_9EURY|nr:ATPase domain-containing protein [Methanohalophilus portucalensis]ATU08447.1 circadian clock protein KaiC [Methanohalophilus portucalensis]OJH49795.1 circadian clock protein, KaiC [Methanohalophilus portucalensis FDF-1]RNI13386.1 circadian clock protein KaiC [Methanohalophilus portucalensis FDF-1]SMH33793.1 RecA-superfamily ATPase, KaiC/GvpD/RAD55 family [Methanohalophilus portucalensis FDF-1]